MVLPECEQTAHQIVATQQRTVFRLCRSEGDVIAAAGAGMGAVELKRLGAQTGLTGFVVHGAGDHHQFAPRRCWLHVDLDHSGIGGHD